MRAFAQAEKFVSEVEGRKLRPVYVFVGDEAFFRKKCRDAILKSLVPDDLREFSLYELDLSETDLAEVLDGGTKHHAPDAAETVDADLDGHENCSRE